MHQLLGPPALTYALRAAREDGCAAGGAPGEEGADETTSLADTRSTSLQSDAAAIALTSDACSPARGCGL